MLNHYGFNPDDEINNSGFKNEEEEDEEDEEDEIEDDDDDEEEDEDEEEDDDEDEGISFEKYVALRTKMDPCGDDKEAHDKILQTEGYSREDWDFYDRVWSVEMTNPERLNQFSELYAQYTKKN